MPLATRSTVKPPGETADAHEVTQRVQPSAAAEALTHGDGTATTEVAGPDSNTNRRAAFEHVAVLAAIAALMFPVAHAEGGRGDGAIAWLAILTALAVVATRPWRRLRSAGWLVVPVLSVAALVVIPLTGVGRGGAVAAATYVVTAGLAVAAAAYARSPLRRAAIATLLCAGGVAQFAWALVPWWGSGYSSSPMVGTYYWHDQFAVAMLMPALLGLGLAVCGQRPWRFAGWVMAPLGVAGVVFSTSRATLACLVVGWVLVVGVCLWSIERGESSRKAWTRAVAATALAVGLILVLPGPPLFPTHQSPFSGASARASTGETVASGTAYRTEFWREAITVTAHHPLAGGGYGRIGVDSARLVPPSWAHSALAHSGLLQAFGDGGLLLGVPVLLALVLAVAAVLRRFRLRRGGGPATALVGAAAVAFLAALTHGLIDTDWTYPALVCQFGVLLGLVLAAPAWRRSESNEPNSAAIEPIRSHDIAARTAAAVLVAALAVAAAVAWGQPFAINNPPAASTAPTSSPQPPGGHP